METFKCELNDFIEFTRALKAESLTVTDANGKTFAVPDRIPAQGELLIQDGRGRVRIIWEVDAPTGTVYLGLMYAAFIWFGRTGRLAKLIKSLFESTNIVPGFPPDAM